MQTKYGKSLFALFISLAVISFGSMGLAEEKQTKEDKAAVVNRVVITQEDLEKEVNRAKQRALSMGRPFSDSQMTEIKKSILGDLIGRELLYQESQKQGMKIKDDVVNEQIDTLRKRFKTEAEFKDVLSKMNLTENSIRAELKRAMAVQKLIEENFANKIKILDKDIKVYYDKNPNFFSQPERVRASHILIKLKPDADKAKKAEARKKLEKVQEQLKKGEDFADLAKQFSEGPTGARGGDLGYFEKGQMVGPFSEVAFTLKPGDVSDIVETQFGYHLIKTVDKKPATVTPYEEAKVRIEDYLKKERIQKEITPYIAELKNKAKIETFLTGTSKEATEGTSK